MEFSISQMAQMPFLREICVLKGLEMPLKDIQEILQSNECENAVLILREHLSRVQCAAHLDR